MMMMRLLSALALCHAGTSEAINYPVKSTNLATAPTVSFYKTVSEGSLPNLGTVTDLHAVHGIQTADGGYVQCGKGMEADGSSLTEGFCAKLDSTGAVVWAWKSGVAGNDAANAVAELPGGTELLVAGWRLDGAVGKRCISKLTAATGVEVWSFTDFGDTTASHGAFEFVSILGNDAVLVGLKSKPDLSEMSFKSYGNVPSGLAVVQKIPVSSLTAATPPSATAISWEKTFTGYLTAKAARLVPASAGARYAVLLYGGDASPAVSASVVLIKASDGTTVWGPTNYGVEHGEGTDLQVSYDNSSIVIVGQGGPLVGSLKTYSGRLTSLSAATGARAWTQSFDTGGEPTIIYHECWGATAFADGGYGIACGVGIEGTTCATLSGTAQSNCNQGIGDSRAGAIPRKAGNWASLVIRTNSSGGVEWMRVDSFKEPSFPVDGSPNPSDGSQWSSAAEWLTQTQDGGLAVFTDELAGLGLMKLVGGACLTNCPCVGAWGAWGACNVTCGGGTQSRSYTISTQPTGSGSACPAAAGATQSQLCGTGSCGAAAGTSNTAKASAGAAADSVGAVLIALMVLSSLQA
eukprot:COSAG01_NODE_852_length_13108_cov_7.167423_6_plen_577_part_00